MTKLLISVKDVEESRIARYAGVDVIDLKEPNVGALGALSVDVVGEIVREVDGSVFMSATVGEGHQTIEALKADILLYASLHVDVIKIAVSDLFQQAGFFAEIRRLTAQGIKIVAVFFADSSLEFNLITQLRESGFYGAMLDTQLKQSSLLEVQSIETLSRFVHLCKQHQLISGLAGSVNKEHVVTLLALQPTFIGLRGGVCHKKDRTSKLVIERITEVKAMLLKCNIV